MAVNGAGEKTRLAVLEWPGVTAHPHRFGGIEFRLGTREIGHMHSDWLVDIPFPTRVRDELVTGGLAEPHHILSDTGWISFYVREEGDIDRAVALLRRSYELAQGQKPRGQESL